MLTFLRDDRQSRMKKYLDMLSCIHTFELQVDKSVIYMCNNNLCTFAFVRITLL